MKDKLKPNKHAHRNYIKTHRLTNADRCHIQNARINDVTIDTDPSSSSRATRCRKGRPSLTSTSIFASPIRIGSSHSLLVMQSSHWCFVKEDGATIKVLKTDLANVVSKGLGVNAYIRVICGCSFYFYVCSSVWFI